MKAVPTVVAALAISLLIWTYFYMKGLKLGSTETEVVVGICLILLFGLRWAWGRVRNTKPTKTGPGKTEKTVGIVILACLGSCVQSRAVVLACSPDTPLVPAEESVVLRAWTGQESRQTVHYTWTVTAGVIQGQGHQVNWSLKGVEAGIFTAEVKLDDASEPNAVCSIRVIVFEPERGTEVKRETGRSFLVKGAKEASGYGLYSYLLLGSPPTDATRDRYLKTLQAYLGIIYRISDLEEYVTAREKLNITYLPVGVAPEQDPTAVWLLEHYDYARARVYLDLLPGSGKDGIYLVSCSKALSGGSNPPYLFQDLSTVPVAPEDLVTPWVKEFLNQAAQEQFWEPHTTENLVLKLRTTIAVLATGLPDVQNALHKWIAWVH
jgi:hypothetical protein